jgi:hypothetical protein
MTRSFLGRDQMTNAGNNPTARFPEKLIFTSSLAGIWISSSAVEEGTGLRPDAIDAERAKG